MHCINSVKKLQIFIFSKKMRKLKTLKMARKVSWDRQLYIILAGYNTGTVPKPVMKFFFLFVKNVLL